MKKNLFVFLFVFLFLAGCGNGSVPENVGVDVTGGSTLTLSQEIGECGIRVSNGTTFIRITDITTGDTTAAFNESIVFPNDGIYRSPKQIDDLRASQGIVLTPYELAIIGEEG